MGANHWLQVNYALKTKSLTVTVVSGVISVSGFRLYIKRASTAYAVDAFLKC